MCPDLNGRSYVSGVDIWVSIFFIYFSAFNFLMCFLVKSMTSELQLASGFIAEYGILAKLVFVMNSGIFMWLYCLTHRKLECRFANQRHELTSLHSTLRHCYQKYFENITIYPQTSVL